MKILTLLAATALLACPAFLGQAAADETETGAMQVPAEAGAEKVAKEEAEGLDKSDRLLGVIGGARVSSKGVLQPNGVRVLRAKRIGKGRYEVIFSFKVNRAVHIGSIGVHATSIPPAGTVTTANRAGNRYGVWVETRTPSGQLADLPFNLIALSR